MNWKFQQNKDQKVIKSYLIELVVKDEVPDLIDRIKSSEILANIFDKADLQYLAKKSHVVASLPESLFKSEPSLIDTSKKRKCVKV